MKKIWISLTLAALAVPVVAACDDGADEGSAETPEATATPERTAEEAEQDQAAEESDAVDEAVAAGDMQVEGMELTCESFVDHLVQLMGDTEGSFITADNRDEWVARCNAKGDLAEHQQVASCILAAETIEQSQQCGETRFINRWALD